MATMNNEHSIYTRIAARGSECHLVGWFPVVKKFRAEILMMILDLGTQSLVRTKGSLVRTKGSLVRTKGSLVRTKGSLVRAEGSLVHLVRAEGSPHILLKPGTATLLKMALAK